MTEILEKLKTITNTLKYGYAHADSESDFIFTIEDAIKDLESLVSELENNG